MASNFAIGQYIYKEADKDTFMTDVTSNYNLTSWKFSNDSYFSNVSVGVPSETTIAFQPNTVYYVHGLIKGNANALDFKVKLEDGAGASSSENITQWVKDLSINAPTTEWIDFEIIFTPIIGFKKLVFELQVIDEDYTSPRKPYIILEEVSTVNNIMGTDGIIGTTEDLVKIGVQSVPHFITVINQEEIHVPLSGIYELNNGDIIVTTFGSIIGQLNRTSLSTIEEELTTGGKIPSYYNGDVDCVLVDSVDRTSTNFTLDYLYRTVS